MTDTDRKITLEAAIRGMNEVAVLLHDAWQAAVSDCEGTGHGSGLRWNLYRAMTRNAQAKILTCTALNIVRNLERTEDTDNDEH